MELLQIYSPFD